MEIPRACSTMVLESHGDSVLGDARGDLAQAQMTDAFFTAEFFDQVVLGITSVLLAAMAGTLSQRAGSLNIALEGQMLVGAFAAVAGRAFRWHLLAAVLLAVVAAVAFSGLLAFGSAPCSAATTL